MFHHKVLTAAPDREWVVLLHGLGGSSSIWYKQVDAYAGEFNVLLVDLYGHGKTGETLPEYSFAEMGREVFRVMDHLGIGSAHLVGISFGSVLAKIMCVMAPERARSLVLGGGVTGLDFRSRFLLNLGKMLRFVMPYMWLYRLFALIMMPRRRHAKSRGIFVREAKKLGRSEFQKWYRLIQTFPGFSRELCRDLRQTPVPKLFISGSEDYLFCDKVRAYVRTDPAARLHVIEKCGHVCNIERPLEFNAISLRYMMGSSSACPVLHAGQLGAFAPAGALIGHSPLTIGN